MKKGDFRIQTANANSNVGSKMWGHVANFGFKMCLTTALSGTGALRRTYFDDVLLWWLLASIWSGSHDTSSIYEFVDRVDLAK